MPGVDVCFLLVALGCSGVSGPNADSLCQIRLTAFAWHTHRPESRRTACTCQSRRLSSTAVHATIGKVNLCDWTTAHMHAKVFAQDPSYSLNPEHAQITLNGVQMFGMHPANPQVPASTHHGVWSDNTSMAKCKLSSTTDVSWCILPLARTSVTHITCECDTQYAIRQDCASCIRCTCSAVPQSTNSGAVVINQLPIMVHMICLC